MTRQTNHVIEFLKIKRGGERFWVRVLSRGEKTLVKCDTYTSDESSPSYGEEFELPEGEVIYDSFRSAPSLRGVQ